MENLKPPQPSGEGQNVPALMEGLGREARKAARVLALASTETKNTALLIAAQKIREHTPEILASNAQDIGLAKAKGLNGAFIDRLTLDTTRVAAMANVLEDIASFPDPVGREMVSFERPNGMRIDRVATPLGVIGIIYEARPAVTADAGALCLKSGNACILRGGSESFFSTEAIHQYLVEGLRGAGLPEAAIIRVPSSDRAAVGEMLKGLNGDVDLIVPRGGRELVARVQAEARVPVFAHLEGIVHVYIHAGADPAKALNVLRNSKMRRTGICGAAETLLVDREAAESQLAPLVKMLLDSGCSVRGDSATCTVDPRVSAAIEEDWRTEYLDAIISVRVVEGLDGAIEHIETYGSHHTDCIITENQVAAERFLREVDSAICVHNASTQFADGGEFGFGAEIGIATGRMHARGPVGLEQLTTFKYRIHGSGQIRP